TVYTFPYAKALPHHTDVQVATFRYSHSEGVTLVDALPQADETRPLWGLKPGQFHRVTALTLSPNHWRDNSAGNAHYFFILDGCRQEGQARGFYNEMLRQSLAPHRKVFELVGATMVVADDPAQLSGLGFSTTQHTEVVVRVTSTFTRTLRVRI